ncbi:MAG: PTS sugar transporter subunit IIA, partial [Alkalibacterium sp.]|nr:PTS sugar transporter subunit IIA [Alkalibacterium sp.]
GQHEGIRQPSDAENKMSRHHLSRLIDAYFNSDLFILSDTIKSREEALDALTERSVKLDSQINPDFLKRQLKLRESFSSVVFSENIAVPHPIEGVGEFSKVGILISPQGIDWDESSQDVKLTIMMVPDRFGNNHLDEVSKALLPIIENQAYLDEVVQATSFIEFKETLLKLLA